MLVKNYSRTCLYIVTTIINSLCVEHNNNNLITNIGQVTKS
jgi:hypothetical protein